MPYVLSGHDLLGVLQHRQLLAQLVLGALELLILLQQLHTMLGHLAQLQSHAVVLQDSPPGRLPHLVGGHLSELHGHQVHALDDLFPQPCQEGGVGSQVDGCKSWYPCLGGGFLGYPDSSPKNFWTFGI